MTTTTTLVGIAIPTIILIASGAVLVVAVIFVLFCLYAMIRLTLTPEAILLAEAKIHRRRYEQSKVRRRRIEGKSTSSSTPLG